MHICSPLTNLTPSIGSSKPISSPYWERRAEENRVQILYVIVSIIGHPTSLRSSNAMTSTILTEFSNARTSSSTCTLFSDTSLIMRFHLSVPMSQSRTTSCPFSSLIPIVMAHLSLTQRTGMTAIPSQNNKLESYTHTPSPSPRTQNSQMISRPLASVISSFVNAHPPPKYHPSHQE